MRDLSTVNNIGLTHTHVCIRVCTYDINRCLFSPCISHAISKPDDNYEYW